MIERKITKKILELSKKFPVIAIIGPRQSGKTTLAKHIFPEKDYINLEAPDSRLFAQEDSRTFLSDHSHGLIIDEAQQVPDLFSYIQTIVDDAPMPGHFILTGSQHFLLHEKISQTLAGRVAIFQLLPFSLAELQKTPYFQNDYSYYLYTGFYPAIYDRSIAPKDWFPNYVHTYVERDIRLLKNISNLDAFTRFLKMCAGRIGQLLNLTSLSNEMGITINTVKAWLSVLEASFIIFLLQPHFKNFNKRLVKTPKLYFHDTGLAAYLLGIENRKQIKTHYLKGGLFENLIISEFYKHRLNNGSEPRLYFWRDKIGREIDCIIENGNELKAVEIKSAQTITKEFQKNIIFWNKISDQSAEHAYVVYGGDDIQIRSHAQFIPWRNIKKIFE